MTVFPRFLPKLVVHLSSCGSGISHCLPSLLSGPRESPSENARECVCRCFQVLFPLYLHFGTTPFLPLCAEMKNKSSPESTFSIDWMLSSSLRSDFSHRICEPSFSSHFPYKDSGAQKSYMVAMHTTHIVGVGGMKYISVNISCFLNFILLTLFPFLSIHMLCASFSIFEKDERQI